MSWQFKTATFLAALALVSPALAQDVGRVMPASIPLPLPGSSPMPPDRLRAYNPWNLPMTGVWHFALTHGQTVDNGTFLPADDEVNGIRASSNEGGNPPVDAFDGNDNTRWCASDSSFPQFLQADLGRDSSVTGVDLKWESPSSAYQFRLEGRADSGKWRTLVDDTATPGAGDGPLSFPAQMLRYVRVTIVGVSYNKWASIREFKISYTNSTGQSVVWTPSAEATPAVSPAVRDQFVSTAFDDSGWDKISVPSNWEMLGYSLPTYNAVDNTVGQYRRWVSVPASWNGRRIYWHFDGALDGAEIFVNGQRAGYHESGYTAFDVDLTGLVKPGALNLFAVRVSKSVPSDDCETGDFQAMGGIYRDTSLISVPQTHVYDITVQTPLSPNYVDATLKAALLIKGVPGAGISVVGKLSKIDGALTPVTVTGSAVVNSAGVASVAMSAPVKAPALWSAEKPNLYYLTMQISSGGKPIERVEQRFGFKQIEIKNNIVLWNGKPIKCTGVCRHDFWADKGFALTDTEWNKDLTMMKAANINSIRTSHYNHAQRFLELCEERGMYILDEVPFCWIGDSVKDPKFAPYLMQRAVETFERDKNRPCVLAWSIGNENPPGPDSQAIVDWLKPLDPTRPLFVSCQNPGDVTGQSWEDDHYPTPGDVDRIAANTAWGANFSEHPHIFYQKETQDYDPGASDLWSEALSKIWQKQWQSPTILGSFIWEWQNQGIADLNKNKTSDFWYGADGLRDENNKGIVDSYRNPKPEWWIVKMVYSPVVVGGRDVSPAAGVCTVPLTNHYSFTDLKELTCRWTALAGGTTLKSGVTHIACQPMQSVVASFPAPAGMSTLRLEFDHVDGTSVVAANLPVTGVPLPSPPPALAPGSALAVQQSPETLTVGNDAQSIVFDKTTGLIQSWRVRGHDLLLRGPVVNLGQAKAGHEKGYYYAAQPPVTQSAAVSAVPAALGAVDVSVAGNLLASAAGDKLGTLTTNYLISPDSQIVVTWHVDWDGPDTHLWDEGLEFTLPASATSMTWQRDSLFLDYPADHIGAPSGTTQATDISFRSSKRDLHWMTLTDSSGIGVTLMPNTQPLVGRASSTPNSTDLYASTQVAGPVDLSGSWVTDHDIVVGANEPIGGSFILRAVAR